MGKASSSPLQRSNQRLRNESSVTSTGLNNGIEDFPRLIIAAPSIGASGVKVSNPSSSNQGTSQEFREESTGIKSNNNGYGMNWSFLFTISESSVEDFSLDFQTSVVMEGNKGVDLSSKNFEDQTKKCEHLVICFFAGNRLSYPVVQKAVTKIWNLKSEVRISIHGDNAFVFNFVNEEDRRAALEQGAFLIGKKLFLLDLGAL